MIHMNTLSLPTCQAGFDSPWGRQLWRRVARCKFVVAAREICAVLRDCGTAFVVLAFVCVLACIECTREVAKRKDLRSGYEGPAEGWEDES